MNNKVVLSTIAIALTLTPFAPATQTPQHKHISQTQLNKIINNYASIARNNNSITAIEHLLKSHKHILTNEISAVLHKYTDENRKDNLLEFDPILNTQDPSEHYSVGKIKAFKTKYFVEVFVNGNNTRISTPVSTIELKRINGFMLISNIHYGSDTNLLQIAKQQGLTVPSTTPASPARTQQPAAAGPVM